MTHAHPHGSDMPTTQDEVVGISRLCVEFDGEHVLEDVNLTIGKGELIALLGPNGSGKTTLVRAITGLQPFAHGRITLFGEPLDWFRSWQRIALVPQRLPGASTIPVSVSAPSLTVYSKLSGPE